jgi:hypothetical protein
MKDILLRARIELQKAEEELSHDTETLHARADAILCDVILAIDDPEAKELIDSYNLIDKWYA